jgi:predicted dehydrogenase
MRWGVIGTGWIADRFVRALQQNTDQSVLAVAARNAERAAAFAQAHGIERSHSTPEQMVSGADVDVVYVATTHPAHLPTALLSLEAGKPTVVEKPLGLNASEARRIADAARQARVFCMEALWMVFLPKFDVIRQILYSGLLGDVRSVLADHGEWFPRPPDHGRRPGRRSDARPWDLPGQLRHLGARATAPGAGCGAAAPERRERRSGSDPHCGG